MEGLIHQEQEPKDTEKWMDSLLSSLGSAFSDLNCVVCEQLNDNFALRNNLPQCAHESPSVAVAPSLYRRFLVSIRTMGKLVSDWLALAAGIRGFDLARSTGEAHLASFALAPCNSLPVNPFTGRKEDIDCLLEAMSGLASDSAEASTRAAYGRLAATRRFEPSPRELFARVSAFNKSLEGLMQAFDGETRASRHRGPQRAGKGSHDCVYVVEHAESPLNFASLLLLLPPPFVIFSQVPIALWGLFCCAIVALASAAKPQPYRVGNSLLAASSVVQASRKPKDAGQLEALLADAKFCMRM
ncbi:mediator complex subunit med8 [Cyclospora cayetanensis]|uniref:Mediator complex subunit med8 n=1 Tax=Cyclospora cayetanensis TaxID=88456 RepID=A0A1D3CYR1_9EIME|nr:mediator complex subunit med8 [Cyclospora cayetanensis]